MFEGDLAFGEIGQHLMVDLGISGLCRREIKALAARGDCVCGMC